MLAVLTAGGIKADNQKGVTWDPPMIVITALRELGPNATAAQVRQYIAGLTGFAGINGIHDFKVWPLRGFGMENTAVFSYDGERQRWLWKSKPVSRCPSEPLAPAQLPIRMPVETIKRTAMRESASLLRCGRGIGDLDQ
jgi:hypothetical protein